MKPLVSIVIPVYNSGRFLKETLASVANQDYESIEVILSDSGSNDEATLSLLKDLSANYKVVYAGDNGVSVARNKGIEVAKGEYILALDSDDLIDKTLVRRFANELDKDKNVSVVRCNIELFGKKKGKMDFAPFDFSILLARNLMVVTSMFRKIDWERVGGFDPDFKLGFEDWEFWINLLQNGSKVATIEDHLFKYRIRRRSKNHSLTKQQLYGIRKQIWEKHRKLYQEYYVSPLESFEYKLLEDSMALKVGGLILKPFESFKLIK